MLKQRTKSATGDALTAWRKSRVFVGTLNLDDFIGADFYFSEPDPADFELSLKTESASEEYKLTATMDVYTPTVDLCQGQVDGVKAAQGVVDGIEDLLDCRCERVAARGPVAEGDHCRSNHATQR